MSSRRKHWAVTCARLLRLHARHASSSAAAAANAAAAHPRERPTSLCGVPGRSAVMIPCVKRCITVCDDVITAAIIVQARGTLSQNVEKM